RVEEERRADGELREPERQLDPEVREEGRVREERREPARRREPDADRGEPGRAERNARAGRLRAAGDRDERRRADRDEAPDEPPARQVVPTEEHPHGRGHHERVEEARRDLEHEDTPLHRPASSRRNAAKTRAVAKNASESTVISPSVSSARKSTRRTFTTLRPCASGSECAPKYSASAVDAVPVPLAATMASATAAPSP